MNIIKKIQQRLIRKIHSYTEKSINKSLHLIFSDADKKIQAKWLNNRCCFSRGGKYCYFRIPKCATSTISKTLAYNDPTIDYSYQAETDLAGDIAKKKFSNLLSTNVLSSEALRKKFFLFSFFRNPYSRILSTYLDKIANNKKNYKYIVKINPCYFARDKKINFEGFVTFLEEGGLYADPHWAPQTSLIPIKLSELSFLGKFETLDRDLCKLMDILFGKRDLNKIINVHDSRYFAKTLFSQYYTDVLKKRIYKIYEKDFNLLSYKKDINELESFNNS